MLQSTLRELRTLVRSTRLWVTFGSVVLLFAVTGPYETAEKLAFLPRLAYWLLLHAGAWFFALTFVVIADVTLRQRIAGMFLRMLIGALVAVLPIGFVVEALQSSWFGIPFTARGYAGDVLISLPLCMIFCAITYMAMSGGDRSDNGAPRRPADSHAVVASEPLRADVPLLERLNPDNRGRLQHISVEDHYTVVRTSRGRELILLRFSDAIRETGTADGIQVHRSHWVAKDFVERIASSNGKISLTLKDGGEVPVSRTYAETARTYFPS